MLAADRPLPHKNYDHPLPGEWSDHRDCPVRPDLILIYRKPGAGSGFEKLQRTGKRKGDAGMASVDALRTKPSFQVRSSHLSSARFATSMTQRM
jgi:Bacterial toxin of type II toxin-antitoxin system, YafQ